MAGAMAVAMEAVEMVEEEMEAVMEAVARAEEAMEAEMEKQEGAVMARRMQTILLFSLQCCRRLSRWPC